MNGLMRHAGQNRAPLLLASVGFACLLGAAAVLAGWNPLPARGLRAQPEPTIAAAPPYQAQVAASAEGTPPPSVVASAAAGPPSAPLTLPADGAPGQSASAQARAVSAAAAAPPSPLPVRLRIDAIKLSTSVVPTDVVGGVWQVADFAAGYLDGSGLPGQPGNVALAGHDDIQGAVFRQLKTLRVGQPIVVSSSDHDYRYVIDGMRYVSPSDTSVLRPTADARLTLITCWPDFFTPKAAYNSLRLVVQAKLAP